MHDIIIEEPYRFIPPHRGRFWPAVFQLGLKRYLRRSHGIHQVDCRGVEKLQRSLQEGHGILLCPNHCRPPDPMMLALLSREVGVPFHTMASWHLFKQGRFLAWALPRIGVFSVYREGLDREALKQAAEILKEAKRPLVIFPEGMITRTNDRLGNLMDGTAFIARNGAKQRAALSPPGRVVIHPVAIRYKFQGDVTAAVAPVLEEIEKRLTWRPRPDLSLVDRIIRVGDALLSLKELEFLGERQAGPIKERIALLIDKLLDPLEVEWLKGKRKGDTFVRVKGLRTAILPDLVSGEISEEERARRWRQLADLYLVQQLSCYPPDYVASRPTPDRMLETIERFEEDLTDHARVHSPIHAVVEVGEAIEVSPERDRGAAVDPVMQALGSRLQELLDRLGADSSVVAAKG